MVLNVKIVLSTFDFLLSGDVPIAYERFDAEIAVKKIT